MSNVAEALYVNELNVVELVAYLTHPLCRPDSAQLAECLSALDGLCRGNAENQRFAGERGAIQAVVEVMNHHKQIEHLQDNGCLALDALCTGNAENQRFAGERGAIQAVVEAMKHHKQIERLQKNGCFALYALCTGNAENKREALSNDAYVTALHAMEEFSSSETLETLVLALIALLYTEHANSFGAQRQTNSNLRRRGDLEQSNQTSETLQDNAYNAAEARRCNRKKQRNSADPSTWTDKKAADILHGWIN